MFIVLILFDLTKKYFDNWIKHLAAYALQPVLMFGALYIMTTIFLELWNSLMDFDVCWGQLLKLYMPLSSWTQGYLPNINLGCVQFFAVKGGIDYINMFGASFALTIFTFAINNIMSHIPEITDSITAVYTASTLSNKANQTVQQAMDAPVNMAEKIAAGAKKLGNAASNIARSGGKKDSGAGVQMGDAPPSGVGGASGGAPGGKPRGKLRMLASMAKNAVVSAAKSLTSGGGEEEKEEKEGGIKGMMRKGLEQVSEMMDNKDKK